MDLKDRAARAGRNLVTALAFLSFFILATEREARAYTDPGTGAMIWQMLAAGAVGVLFYFRRFLGWFKPKKKDPQD